MRTVLLLIFSIILTESFAQGVLKHYQGGRQINFGLNVEYEHERSFLHSSYAENALIVTREWDLGKPELQALANSPQIARNILGQIPEWDEEPLHVEQINKQVKLDRVQRLGALVKYLFEESFMDIYTDATLRWQLPQDEAAILVGKGIVKIESTEAWYFNSYTHRFENRILYLKLVASDGTEGYIDYTYFMKSLADEYYSYSECPEGKYTKLPVYHIYYKSGRCPACQAVHKEFWDKGSFFYRHRNLAKITKIQRGYGDIRDSSYYREADVYLELNLMHEKASRYTQVNDDEFKVQAPDGQLINGEKKKGQPTGAWTWAYKKGSPRLEVTYLRGKPDGEVRLYYPDGTLKEEGRFHQGERTGTWKSYWPGGKLLAQRTYNNGLPYGSYKLFHKNGDPYAALFYEKGLKNGELVLWAKDGTELEKCNYALDRLYGYGTFQTINIQDKKTREKLFEEKPQRFEVYANGDFLYRVIFNFSLTCETIKNFQLCGSGQIKDKVLFAEAQNAVSPFPEGKQKNKIELRLDLKDRKNMPVKSPYTINIKPENGQGHTVSPKTSYPDVQLEPGENYTLTITQANSPPLKITVDTHIPEDMPHENIRYHTYIQLCLCPSLKDGRGALLHVKYIPQLLGFGVDFHQMMKGMNEYGVYLSW